MYAVISSLLFVYVTSSNGQHPIGLENENLLSQCDDGVLQNCILCDGLKSLQSYRTFDGTCNNLQAGKKDYGAAKTTLKRLLPAEYHSVYPNYPRGFHTLDTTQLLPTAIEVAKTILSDSKIDNSSNVEDLTVLFMTFGQFLDHDLTLTLSETPSRACNTTCNPNSMSDHHYPCFPLILDRKQPGCRQFIRSKPACPALPNATREQINTITSFIDGSAIYGFNDAMSRHLRDSSEGLGKMLVRRGNVGDLLPTATQSEEACITRGGCFLAGDTRVNENVALASMHTFWMRVHNSIATDLKILNNHWHDSRLFHEARRITIAILQHITFTEFLPQIYSVPSYSGYKKNADPSIFNSFATAAFRFGHSLVPNFFSQCNAMLEKVRPDLTLQNAFFNNQPIFQNGMEEIFLGLVKSRAENVDTIFSNGIKEKLFVPLGQSLQEDLTALNIQRGRDHGLPPYVKFRKYCNLYVPSSFEDLKKIPGIADKWNLFKAIYTSVNDIDLFVAGIAETHVVGHVVGPTFQCIIKKQFENIRNGDRYWYANPGVFQQDQFNSIRKLNFKQVVCDVVKDLRQSGLGLPDNIFKAIGVGNPKTDCRLPDFSDQNLSINLLPWSEIE